MPPGTPESLQLAGERVDGSFLRGFLCFGCPVGEDGYVKIKLKEVADRCLDDARRTMEVLVRDQQALWCSLRSSINQRFDYWCQLARPSLSRPVAAYLDRELWQVLEAAVGFQVPRSAGLLPGPDNCVLNVPVLGCEAKPILQ